MNLQDFITETLIQISQGVNNAKQKIGSNQFQINPKLDERWFSGAEENKDFIGLTKEKKIVQTVNFDISVMVESESNKGGEIKVASIIEFGISGKGKNSEQNISKIKFSIPIAFPEAHEK